MDALLRLHRVHGAPAADLIDAHLSVTNVPFDTPEEEEEAREFIGLRRLRRVANGEALLAMMQVLTFDEVERLVMAHPMFSTLGQNIGRWITLNIEESRALYHTNWVTRYGWDISGMIREVNLRFLPSVDLTRLRGIVKVSLVHIDKIENLGALSDTKFVRIVSCVPRGTRLDVSSLKNNYSVHFLNCRRFNYGTLTNVTELKLEDCDVVDARPFANVPYLGLRGNPSIQSAEGLGKQITLDLQHTNVTRIDNLANVKYLLLDGPSIQLPTVDFTCTYLRYQECSLRNLTWARKVPYLDLSYARVPIDLSIFAQQRALWLQRCKVGDVSYLTDVPFLNLYVNHELTNVDKLTEQQFLGLRHTRVSDATPHADIPYLDLSYTDVEDVSSLGSQVYLDLAGTKLRDIDSLLHVRSLQLLRASIKRLPSEPFAGSVLSRQEYDIGVVPSCTKDLEWVTYQGIISHFIDTKIWPTTESVRRTWDVPPVIREMP
jgi:hypothetical protein